MFLSNDLFRRKIPDVEETGEIVELPQIRLDDLAKEKGFLPSVIVIDVQGAEHEVLAGGTETLTSALIVEVEVSEAPIYEGGAAFKDVDRLLVANGFTRVTSVSWHGDVVYMRLDKFNEKQIEEIYAQAKRIERKKQFGRFKRALMQPKRVLRKLMRIF